ncbi:MAG: hypothetical protein KDD70_08445 [Bdellovibrionales bacterium]|nr:hypothetical protein [Bdellovibrionales bacterium]
MSRLLVVVVTLQVWNLFLPLGLGWVLPPSAAPAEDRDAVAGSNPVRTHLAFPGAVGAGKFSIGGSGRQSVALYGMTSVFKVNNLKDNGAGSLRRCTDAVGSRVCVFEVSGEIRLKKALVIRNPYVTIAGYTAPNPGVTLRGAGIAIEASDVVVQHLTVRVGDDPNGPDPRSLDGLRIGSEKDSVQHVIVDHLSVSWAIDENFSTIGDVQKTTVSSSIFAEGLNESIHPKGKHSKGLLVNGSTKEISLIGNLVAHNGERNPLIQAGARVQFLNNVVYGWGDPSRFSLCNISDSSDTGAGITLDFAGNNYLPSPASHLYASIYGKPVPLSTRIYVGDNLGPKRDTNAGPRWQVVNLPKKPFRLKQANFTDTDAIALNPEDGREGVLSSAGAHPAYRDAVDTRVIHEVKSRTGQLKDCVESCPHSAGGWPKVEEKKRSLVPPINVSSDPDGDGYTVLDDWLFGYLEKANTVPPESDA